MVAGIRMHARIVILAAQMQPQWNPTQHTCISVRAGTRLSRQLNFSSKISSDDFTETRQILFWSFYIFSLFIASRFISRLITMFAYLLRDDLF